MSPLREISDGLTREEIDGRIESAKDKVRDFVREEMKEQMSAQNEALERQNVILDKLADGMQRIVLGNVLLLGDENLGVKGKIQELSDRVEHQEAMFDTRCKADDDWRLETRGRLEKLEAGQHRIQRCVTWTVNKAAILSDDWKKLAAAAGIFVALFRGVPDIFGPLRRFSVWLWHHFRL